MSGFQSSSSLFPNPKRILLLILHLFCQLQLHPCPWIIAQVAVRNMEMFFLLFSDLPSPLATSAPICSPFWALSAVLPSRSLCRTQRWNGWGVWKRLTTLQYYLLLQDITVNPGSPLLFTTALFSFWGNSGSQQHGINISAAAMLRQRASFLSQRVARVSRTWAPASLRE